MCAAAPSVKNEEASSLLPFPTLKAPKILARLIDRMASAATCTVWTEAQEGGEERAK